MNKIGDILVIHILDKGTRMENKYSIKAVSVKTGLSPHLIRMWERRYGVVSPYRTETNRRLYTENDINKLMLLRRATMQGQHIGNIAKMTNDELIEILRVTEPAQVYQTEDTESTRFHLEQCLDAVKKLDSINLEKRLMTASIALSQDVLFDKVLMPLLKIVGELWSNGKLQIAHEHLASAIIRSLLGNLLISIRPEDSNPVFIATTPVGQLHEFGSLMSALSAFSIGYTPVYLGPNIPAEDIANAVKQKKADVISLSLVYPPNDPVIRNELQKIRQFSGDKIKIFIGGQSADSYYDTIKEIDAVLVSDLLQLKSKLKEIRSSIYSTN